MVYLVDAFAHRQTELPVGTTAQGIGPLRYMVRIRGAPVSVAPSPAAVAAG